MNFISRLTFAMIGYCFGAIEPDEDAARERELSVLPLRFIYALQINRPATSSSSLFDLSPPPLSGLTSPPCKDTRRTGGFNGSNLMNYCLRSPESFPASSWSKPPCLNLYLHALYFLSSYTAICCSRKSHQMWRAVRDKWVEESPFQ